MMLVLLLMLAIDLSAVKAEPDLDKRSELALASADQAISSAREAFKAGDETKLGASLGEAKELVQVSYDALSQSRRQARRSKYFKSAELKTRALIRRLMGLGDEVSLEERKFVEDARNSIQEVHDRLLQSIMSNKK